MFHTEQASRVGVPIKSSPRTSVQNGLISIVHGHGGAGSIDSSGAPLPPSKRGEQSLGLHVTLNGCFLSMQYPILMFHVAALCWHFPVCLSEQGDERDQVEASRVSRLSESPKSGRWG
jgi:hypothetical protein